MTTRQDIVDAAKAVVTANLRKQDFSDDMVDIAFGSVLQLMPADSDLTSGDCTAEKAKERLHTWVQDYVHDDQGVKDVCDKWVEDNKTDDDKKDDEENK